MLEARGLAVGPPGGEPAFRDLDFALGPGEWVALTGANGGGKSLFCLALAGLLAPRSGSVLLDGAVLTTISAQRASIGMVFQEPEAQLVAPTLEEELAFPLENLGWPRAAIEERVAWLLAEFGLGPLAGRAPASLSGGEKSRLGLAAALAADPRYLILDEPGVYLDQVSRERLRALVRREVDRGRGALFVTQLEEEWRAADRRLRLERGMLQACDDASPVARGDDGAGLGTGPAGGAVALRARGVSFRYPAAGNGAAPVRPLIESAEIELRGGEVALLTGASGSGKTTFLLLLCGVLSPLAGEIEMTSGLALGALLQSPEDQLVSATVEEDVALGARDRERQSRREIARAALADVGLDAATFAARSPSTLSHGERRRVAWAGLLARRAGLWLLDEPTTGLDAAGILVLQNTLERFASQGGSALVVSQDPRLEAWLTRRYVLEEGRIRT